MSANNYLLATFNNENCVFYFKYGDVREINYHINDKIRWNVVSEPDISAGEVTVPAYKILDLMNFKFEYFKIYIFDNIIKYLVPINEAEYEELEDFIFEKVYANM